MNLKKLLSIGMVVTCISFSLPAISSPLDTEVPVTATVKTVDPAARLKEIKDMDKTNLSTTEKKELRKELKQMKKEVRTSKNGIYLSIGAIVIIVLLLIVLL